MARIVVCDHCRTPEGVHAGQFDLCAKCAIGVLETLLGSDQPAVHVAVMDAIKEPMQDPADRPPPKPFSDEEVAARRMTALFVQHQTKIYKIQPPDLLDKLPQTIKYGPEGEQETVEVLEGVPGKPGWYFAKIVV